MTSEELIKGVYRPQQGTSPALLLPAARSAGHYRVPAGWKPRTARKQFVELFWGIAGEGRFNGSGDGWTLHPGEVCCYFPGDVHEIEALRSTWEYRWLTFDGESCEGLAARLRLRRPAGPAGRCPQELFVQLEQELQDFSLEGRYRAGITVYTILQKAVGEPRGNGTAGWNVVEGFRCLARERYADPEVNIAVLAEELRVHRCTLARLFREHTGISPAEFLLSCRVGEALSLLARSDLRIGEIALRCGFADANYFVKVIRRQTGMTPSRFRHS